MAHQDQPDNKTPRSDIQRRIDARHDHSEQTDVVATSPLVTFGNNGTGNPLASITNFAPVRDKK